MAPTIETEGFPPDVTMGDVVLGVRADIGEDWLALFYLRIKRERLLPVFWHENPSISISEFLAWSKNNIVLGCFLNPDCPTLSTTDIVGVIFINKSIRRGDDLVVEVGEAFVRGLSHDRTEMFARMGLQYCFGVLKAISVFGITPVANRAACLFPKRLGFRVFGPLPHLVGWGGKSSDAMISCMTREDWEAGKG